jgi:8-oxo-dGTP diphosphatase
MRKAAGLVIVNNGRILMVQRRNGRIAIPGGKCEPEERLLSTAIRETYEETGIVATVPDLDWYLLRQDIEGFAFTAYKGDAVAGTLTSSEEGKAFWLDLRCFKNIPSLLQYPEWCKEAITFFDL